MDTAVDLFLFVLMDLHLRGITSHGHDAEGRSGPDCRLDQDIDRAVDGLPGEASTSYLVRVWRVEAIWALNFRCRRSVASLVEVKRDRLNNETLKLLDTTTGRRRGVHGEMTRA